MNVYYMGLERIPARYTLQLEEWNRLAFQRRKVAFKPVYGTMPEAIEGKIVTGSVLDAHGRTHYSLTQMANLVALMQKGQITKRDVVFFEDMFTPGIEALPYIMKQVGEKYRPRVYVRCLAQTIDPDDFVNREGMFGFMRPFEQMVDSFVDGILVASEEMVSYLRIAGFKAPIYVTGLPFGKLEVQRRVKNKIQWKGRQKLVSYAARWDDEKQPLFFLEVAAAVKAIDPAIRFQVLTGSAKLRSNNPMLLKAAEKAVKSGLIRIWEGLSKDEYYQELNNSRLLFNCALQDWVSNTVSEADALGCQTLYPAYRSFPEVFGNDHRHMYLPWSVEDAASKVVQLVNNLEQDIGKVSDFQDQTINRTISVFQGGLAHHYARNGLDYRLNVAEAKL